MNTPRRRRANAISKTNRFENVWQLLWGSTSLKRPANQCGGTRSLERQLNPKQGAIASQMEMHRLRVHPFSHPLIVCALSAVFVGTATADESKSGRAGDCQIGAYRFSDGEIVDIAR